MGFFHKLFNQCAKPEGFLGKMMIGGMNKNTHVRLADWGMSHLELKHAGFSGVKTKHHPSKPWILVLAQK